ncbi:MAG: FUSC family protein [Acidimicrobiales bacterium]
MTGTLAGVVRGVLRVERSKLALIPAIRGSVGMAIPLAIGALTGHLLAGVTVAIGALTSGVAALQGSYRSRAKIMLVATAGFAISAFVGATVGQIEGPDIVLTALWGFVAGLQVAFGQPPTIVGLQSVIGLVVFSQFDFGLARAANEAALVLGGGVLQIVLVALVWPLRRFPVERRALSVAYGRLAEYAGALASAPAALLDPTVLDELTAALADPQPWGNPAEAATYQALADQAERVRLELARVARCFQRLEDAGQGDIARELHAVAAASANVLGGVAGALRSGRAARPGPGDEDRMQVALERLAQASAGAGDSADGWQRAVLALANDAATALAGQLRAIVYLSAVAAGDEPASLPKAATTPVSRVWLRRRVAEGVGSIGDHLEAVRANLTLTSETFRHALRVAVTLAIAVAASHLFPLGHGYWLPLTVIIVLKPDFAATFTRGVARAVGTVAGAGLVTLLLAGLRPPPSGLILLTVVLYAAAITVLQANYAIFSVCIASLVVTLLAFTGQPAIALAADRSFYTVLGATLALAAYALWPTWERGVVADRLAALVEADARYGGAVLRAWADPAECDPEALQRARLAARLARSNAEASVERWLAEPSSRSATSRSATSRSATSRSALNPEAARGILAAVRRYVWGILALHAQLPGTGPLRPEVGHLASQVEEALASVAQALRTRAPTGSLPPLRATQTDLAADLMDPTNDDSPQAQQSPEAQRQAVVIVSESDLMVDAVDALAHLVTVPHVDDLREHEEVGDVDGAGEPEDPFDAPQERDQCQ